MQIQVMTIFEHEHLTSYMRKAGWRRCGINFSPLSKGVSGLLYKNEDWRIFIPDRLDTRQCQRIAERLALVAGILPATVTNSILEEQDEMTETLEEYKMRVRRALIADTQSVEELITELDLELVDDGPIKDEVLLALPHGRFAVRLSKQMYRDYDPTHPWVVFDPSCEGLDISSEEIMEEGYTAIRDNTYVPPPDSPPR